MVMPKRYHNETWWAILEHIEKHMDPATRQYQAPISVIEHAVGVGRRTLFRHFKEMRELSILEITRVDTNFVAGRQPNIYTLLVHVADLRERFAQWDDDRVDPVPVDERLMPPEVRPPSPVEEEVSRDVAEAMTQIRGSLESETEIDGWLAGVD